MKVIFGICKEARFQLALAALLILASYLLVLGPVTTAQDANDTIILDVNISAVAAMEVLPTSISWSLLLPGSNGTVENISVKNIGSYNLTDFYASVDTVQKEPEKPIGTGNITKYAASGFMLFRNESTSLKYYHLGRLEWNLTGILDTEILDLTPGTERWGHGWYRQANGNEYLWKVENGTGGWCNSTNTKFIIKKNPENSSNYQRDLSTSFANATADDNNANWTFFHFTAGEGGPLLGQCVATHYDCTKIYIYKYDMDGGPTGSSFGSCDSAKYFSEDELAPGETIDKLKIKPSIPYGTPAGDSRTSIMTIYTYIA